jgi:phage N-6-adenine-methyltransferase
MRTFRELAEQHGPFDLDVCASEANAKRPKFYTVEEDGLTRDWLADGPRCWMNPPYGETIGAWMAKALEESRRGCKVVCLVPARTDTAWWHDYAMKGEITFIRGRLKFGDARTGAPFPSAMVVFGSGARG